VGPTRAAFNSHSPFSAVDANPIVFSFIIILHILWEGDDLRMAIGAGRPQGFTPPQHPLHGGLQAADFGLFGRSSSAVAANQVRRQKPDELVEVERSFSFIFFSFFLQKIIIDA